MGSFTTNMHSHIALQTKGTTVFLTVKESYIHVYRKEKYLASCKSSNCKLSHTENINIQKIEYQVHFHICHNAGHSRDQQAQPVHVY